MYSAQRGYLQQAPKVPMRGMGYSHLALPMMQPPFSKQLDSEA